jgi:hypothetical protein
MSWRDNSSSSNRSSTNDGNGGSRSGSGSTSGTGGGGNSSYSFRGTKSGQGNWNTGRAVTGHGSISGGITRAPHISLPRATPKPTSFTIPRPVRPVHPMPITPIMSIPIPRQAPRSIGTAIDYFDAQNPGGLWGSTFPARPGATTRMGFRGKDQSRLPGGGISDGFNASGDSWSRSRSQGLSGRVGGGQGGGGGGGW